MRVLVSGHRGYIGAVMVPRLLAAGHEVSGIDSYLYEGCDLGPAPEDVPGARLDVRAATADQLRGIDAVVHLAALSNDPVGDLNPQATYDINHRASVELARAAREAGVQRFLFSSSCSLYGAQGDDVLDEEASFHPVTPYGETKLLAERDLADLADERFAPTFLRNATVYGFSPRLRGDLVVNNLAGYAHASGEVRLTSDGTPWRPLVHVEDLVSAFLTVLDADLDEVRNEAYNVGATSENYQIREVAEIVERAIPGSRVVLAEDAGPDLRNYRVSCEKLAATFPRFHPQWTVERGVRQLCEAYERYGLQLEDLTGPRFQRLRRVRELQEEGVVDDEVRRTSLV